MIPAKISILERIPLLSNGKVDFNRLLEIEELEEIVQPENELEEQILKIWKEVLKIDGISTDKGFFSVGGNSLNIMRLLPKFFSEFGIRITLGDIFINLTIQKQAVFINEKRKSQLSSIAKSETYEGESLEIPMHIERAPRLPYYVLSSSQKRLHFLHMLNPTSIAYNMPNVLKVSGELDITKIERVARKLVARHDSLRTSFSLINDQTVQVVSDKVSFAFEYHEATMEESPELIKNFIRPFELEHAPLIRMGLVKLSEILHLLLIDMHHIVSDGVSQSLLIKDFMAIYNNEKLPEIQLTYKDYAVWQQGESYQLHLEDQQKFWLEEFSKKAPPLHLPWDYERPLMKRYNGNHRPFSFSKQEAQMLRALGEEVGASLFMTLLSILNILLSKLSNQEDITIGTAVSGRNNPGLDGIIGMFVNTLALRNYPLGTHTFKSFLAEVKKNTLKCFEHQAYPYEELIEALHLPRDTSRNPLFDVMMVFQNYELEELVLPGLRLIPFPREYNISKFDLTLNVAETNDGLYLDFEYASYLFQESTIDRFIAYFKRIVSEVLSNGDKLLAQINMIDDHEQVGLLTLLDNTSVSYPREKTVVEIFKEQVARNPHKVALLWEGLELTYEELDEKTDSLGKYLREEGVGRESIVGLMLDRSINMIVGMLSVLKAGGAYLPIDIDYPEDRIEYLLKDSGSIALLTTKDLLGSKSYPVKTLFIESINEPKGKSSSLELVNEPSDLCYIIYTSGTTGNPKGVMIEHKNVVRLFFNDAFSFDFSSEDVWTMFHSPSFDFSVWEIYGALLFGGRLLIIPKMTTRDPQKFLELLMSERVTVLNQTPSSFYHLQDEYFSVPKGNMSLRYVIFGGEALSPANLERWNRQFPKTKLVNLYGITETTVHVTFKEITDYEITHNSLSIGKPIPTTSIFILDPHQRLVPKGVIGEICIGGEGVARGYLNNEELTRQKFVLNPHISGKRIYKSGDLGRINHMGEIEYMGRKDTQVKLRGYRIELGEIEKQLISYKAVKDAVVTVYKKSEEESLVAYYVPIDATSWEEIRDYLLQRIPDYMLPSYYVQLGKMPLNHNGKIDRTALPDPELNLTLIHTAPSNDLEKELVKIWGEVLDSNIERISIDRSFFEMGGNSLKVLRLKKAIEERLSISISVADLFRYPNIQSLANSLSGKETIGGDVKKVSAAQVAEMQDLISLISEE